MDPWTIQPRAKRLCAATRSPSAWAIRDTVGFEPQNRMQPSILTDQA